MEYVLLFIFVLVVTWIIKQNEYRDKRVIGNVGENIVANKLKLLSGEFVVENNVHLGKAQIDHLVINHDKKIVFVIETKMWGGVITGKYNDDKWRQDKNGVVRYFANPMKQNNYHCRIVRERYKKYKVYGVIVFVRNTDVPKYKNIVGENKLVDYINRTPYKDINIQH